MRPNMIVDPSDLRTGDVILSDAGEPVAIALRPAVRLENGDVRTHVLFTTQADDGTEGYVLQPADDDNVVCIVRTNQSAENVRQALASLASACRSPDPILYDCGCSTCDEIGGAR